MPLLPRLLTLVYCPPGAVAVAVPVVGPVARADAIFSCAEGVVMGNRLRPCVFLPLAATPTTLVLYCM